MTPARAQLIYLSARRLVDEAVDGPHARRAGEILVSLWDGRAQGVDLEAVLHLDTNLFQALTSLLALMHDEGLHLRNVLTERQMAPVLEEWAEARAEEVTA